MSADPKLPARGAITAPGLIRLESGEEIRFFETACLRFRPEVGMEVWVIEVVRHPVGKCRWRARVVNLDGAIEADAATQALARHAARDPLINPALARELAKLGSERREAFDALDAPWEIAAEHAIDLRGLAETTEAYGLASCISYLRPADDRQRVLPSDCAFIDTWEEFPEPWCDPCFCPFVSGDGHSLGVFLYPPTTAANLPAPVVFHSRSESPEFLWVAESIAHLERMIAAAHHSKDQAVVDDHRGRRHPEIERALRTAEPTLGDERGEQERSLVRQLLIARDEEADVLAEQLADVYRERQWKFAHAAVSAQRIKDWHLRKAQEASDAAAAVVIDRRRARSFSNAEATRLFAQAVMFEFSGAQPRGKEASGTRYGKSFDVPLTRGKLEPSAKMTISCFGVFGLALIWLASHVSGIASFICGVLGLVLLSPLTLTALATVLTPTQLRLELKQRTVMLPAGFARRRTLTVALRDVTEIGCRVAGGVELLSFRTDEKEFSLPGAMFPKELPATAVALQMWIRWVFAGGVDPIDARALMIIEAACDEAHCSTSGTKFTFVTLEDKTRIVGFMKPGQSPVFPGASERQLDELVKRVQQ